MISSVQLCALLHYVGHGPFVESSVFREHDSIPCVGLDWPTPRIRRHETDRQVVSWVTSCGATLKRSTVDAKTPSRSLICELCSNMDPATSGDCLEACQRRISLSNLWECLQTRHVPRCVGVGRRGDKVVLANGSSLPVRADERQRQDAGIGGIGIV